VYCTPSDLARLLIMQMNSGTYRGKRVLSAGLVREMARVQFAGKEQTSGWGLGWTVEVSEGQRALSHSGGVPGFRSYMVIDPDRRVGAVMLANHIDAPVPELTGQLALGLLRRLK
jgi:D-alanyl-D-alanine carboxypeptidase